MIKYMLIVVALSMLSFSISSCGKDNEQPVNKAERRIRYILYTNEDFNNDEHSITFSVFARDDNKTVLDSAIETMQVKEIPKIDNKIVIEKTLLTEDTTDLVVGFVYEIEGVGVSWYLDSVSAGQRNKTIEFAFR